VLTNVTKDGLLKEAKDEWGNCKYHIEYGIKIGVTSRLRWIGGEVEEYSEHFGQEDAEDGEDHAIADADSYSQGKV